MKRFKIHFLSILMLTLTCLTAQAQTNPFDRFAEYKDVTYVYISKAMLKLIGTNVIPSINGIDVKEIGNKLNSIQIITSEKNSFTITNTYPTTPPGTPPPQTGDDFPLTQLLLIMAISGLSLVALGIWYKRNKK